MSLSLLNSPKSAKHLNSCFLRTVVTNSNWEDMLRASAEVLGKGLLATSYEAYLEDGPMIVVKMLKLAKVATTEFEKLIEQISSIRHKNVATLRAYLCGKDKWLPVYYYYDRGSMIRNCVGILFPSLMNHVQQQLQPFTKYEAPEVAVNRRSQQSDVYSFRVLLLELMVRQFEPAQVMASIFGILWLILGSGRKKAIKFYGKLVGRWIEGVSRSLALCAVHSESRDNLFYECDFGKTLWKKILYWNGFDREHMGWHNEVSWAVTHMKGKAIQAIIYRLAWRAHIYASWMARNEKVHSSVEAPIDLLGL
ncbi:hypothetical protein CRG98_027530 [Punica granatum]|uniref:Protein kinase domain-containing protein n=1 Tax=Punica granatum TaxID=22663 RepID=A0A2I0J7A4_PUNGR|nr:hypothetical protein CRG98_027530 [Punica granatum]